MHFIPNLTQASERDSQIGFAPHHILSQQAREMVEMLGFSNSPGTGLRRE
jgi:hypothetical protein